MPNTIQITLDDMTSANLRDFKIVHANSFNIMTCAILDKIDELEAQLRASENNLRLRVLRGEWRSKERCYRVNKHGKVYADIDDIVLTDRRLFHAPTLPLAEELSQVIQGLYRPTQADIDAKVPFWNCNEYGKMLFAGAYTIQQVSEDLRYFFTLDQRTAYIANLPQQEEKAKAEFFFYDGKLLFAEHKGLVGVEMSSTTETLNKMLAFCRSKGMQ